MAAVFKAGDKAYIIESNRIIRECTVVRASGNLYIIRFENGGGIQVPGHRLFASQEEADNSIPNVRATKRQGFRSPYEYWH